jgi:pimeloyl-ACP methyl ester carboxylesterase
MNPMGKWRRRSGVISLVAGAAAAGVGVALAAEKVAVGRIRLRPDPEAAEPFGELCGSELTVLADDGVALHVEIDGPDDAELTVIFCHGYALNMNCWHYQRRDLGPEYRLVFWDQRSHGRSGRSDSDHATIDQLGADLFAIIRAVVRGGRPVVLVGHSMGGMTIMALAERHPELFGAQAPDHASGAEVSDRASGAGISDRASGTGISDRASGARVLGVALISTAPGKLAEGTLGLPALFGGVVRRAAPGMIKGVGKGRRAMLVDRGRQAGGDLAFLITRFVAFGDAGVSPTLVDFVEQMIRATPMDVIADFYGPLMSHDKLAALPVLDGVPTLVLVGDKDRFTPSRHSEDIAQALPSADLVVVPGTGHLVILEQPEAVTEALRGLIKRAKTPDGQGERLT